MWGDPELAGILAAAIHILRVAMDGVPEEAFGREPRTEMDMYALLDPGADWAAAQVSLDVLGTHIARISSEPWRSHHRWSSCRRSFCGFG